MVGSIPSKRIFADIGEASTENQFRTRFLDQFEHPSDVEVFDLGEDMKAWKRRKKLSLYGMKRTIVVYPTRKLLVARTSSLLKLFFTTTTAAAFLIAALGELAGSLAVSKDEARDAERKMKDFLATISHEIRTPLGVILGYASLLTSAPSKEYPPGMLARAIARNGKHLLELINDILDLSKIESGKLDVKFRPVDVVSFLASLRDQFQDRAIEKGLLLDFQLVGAVPSHIYTDETKLRQIMVNILGNAMKFTDEGHVRVTTTYAEERAEISFVVSDTGCGIPEKSRGAVFESFRQAERFVDRNYGGTGLGLPLARRLAGLLGGQVELVESSVGRGSTFEVRIDSGDPSVETWVDGGDFSGLLERATSSETVQSEIKNYDRRLEGLRIMLAEDHADNQVLFRAMLEIEGANVDVVGEGSSALNKAESQHYDVILMDIQMPGMDGYTATKALRVAGFSGPIIALSAHVVGREDEKFRDAGFSDHISKPVDEEDFIKTIVSHL